MQKWEQKILSGVCFTNQEYYGSFLYKHHNRFIFDFTLMYSYFIYGTSVLRKVVNSNGKLMLISDQKKYTNGIKIAAFKATYYYGCGSWPGGLLTKIKMHTLVPSFVINIGADYPKNFLNEVSLLQIPAITYLFTITHRPFFINNYGLPAINREATLMLNLVHLFIFLARKFNVLKQYTKFSQLKHINVKILSGLINLKNSTLIYAKYTKGIVPFIINITPIFYNKNKNIVFLVCNEQFQNLSVYKKKLFIKEKHKLIIAHKKFIEQTEIHLRNQYLKKKKLNIAQISFALIKTQSYNWANMHKISI